jgi:hypothetical protein
VETLSWELLANHLKSNTPIVLRMGGTRGVQLGYNPSSRRLFVRLPAEPVETLTPSPYAELVSNIVYHDGIPCLEIAVVNQELYPEFHRFAGLLTEEFEEPGRSAIDAFRVAIGRWRDLVSRIQLLSEDEQLGLQGELMFLKALIGAGGPHSVFAWTGRNSAISGRHDFRTGTAEFEIKTTRLATRVHVVHGLSQLEPSESHSLFVISIRDQKSAEREE